MRFRALCRLFTTLLVGFSLSWTAGCDGDTTPGEKVDEALEEAADATEDAVDEVEDEVDDATRG